MADDADLAQDKIEALERTGIEAVTKKLNEQGEKICVDCDDEIPEARREAAPFAKRCIECATIHESREKHYAPDREEVREDEPDDADDDPAGDN